MIWSKKHMEEFYPFFLIIFAGVFFSMVFHRMHFPWVVGLILGGVVAGPHAFDVLKITPFTEFIGQIGLVFLMFMAGLETKFSNFRDFRGGLIWLSFINGAVPFVAGLSLMLWMGYGLIASLLVGIIFISSSIAVVIPSLERFNLLHTRLGQSVVMTTVIQDIASLILLSFVLQSISPVTKLPLYIFYPLVIGVLLFLRFLIPRVPRFFTGDIQDTPDLFQQEFRATFLILIGTVVAFELLGLHPIIAGFFAGLILSDSINSAALKDKIRTISYGIFIPTFFIIVGAQTNFGILLGSAETLGLVVVIVLGSILSKFLSGWIGGRVVGFRSDHALLFAISSLPQLSTTLAVAFTSLALGIIDQKIIAAMVTLSVVTVIVSPVLMNLLGDRITASLDKE
jgi:Kef-type K+ transport system membrane component KefB